MIAVCLLEVLKSSAVISKVRGPGQARAYLYLIGPHELSAKGFLLITAAHANDGLVYGQIALQILCLEHAT